MIRTRHPLRGRARSAGGPVHVEIACELDGLRITRELRSGTWVLDGWGRRVVVREWTWAERRRLLEVCRSDGPTLEARPMNHESDVARDTGRVRSPSPPLLGRAAGFDREHFVAGLVALCCEPVPPRSLWPVYAHVVLGLFGVDGVRPLPHVVGAERRLAEWFGWEPDRIGGQSAVDLDRLLGGLEPAERAERPSAAAPSMTGPEPTWRRIVIDDGA